MNMKFYRPAKDTAPMIGCKKSHIEVIKYAKENNLKNIMVVEDDIYNIVPWDKINLTFPEGDWDILFLGGIISDYLPNHKWPWLRSRVWCAHAYIVNSTFYDTILNDVDVEDKFPIDKYYHDYGQTHKVYTINPIVIGQRQDHSDIANKVRWTKNQWEDLNIGKGMVDPEN